MSKKSMNDILQILLVAGIGWSILAIAVAAVNGANTDFACLAGWGIIGVLAFLTMMYRQTNPDSEADERDEENRKLAQLEKYKKRRK